MTSCACSPTPSPSCRRASRRARRRGRDEIVRRWLERKDGPGETEFRWHPLTVTPEVAVVQGTAVYRHPPRAYSNLWVIRLDPEGRCAEFTEWWVQHPEP